MQDKLQNEKSGEAFTKQMLDIGNDKIPVDSSSLTFSTNFCHFTETKTQLIEKVFPNIAQNYKNHVWLSERVILAAKNVDVNEMNFQIQNNIAGKLILYKSIDFVTNQDDVVNHPTEFLNYSESISETSSMIQETRMIQRSTTPAKSRILLN
ncbi:unnamed protein product [Psylliodes chrysocephalus]|uniref:Uncharacterized protein n=1 Tax=Psylliodes chrysocephalus TaxID=3402493 RepID=A0A9P0D375_9CUCU|nr:unnamed protein product [Psylliodes chrysocephala]